MAKAKRPLEQTPALDVTGPLDRTDTVEVTPAGFRDNFGEELRQVLDLDTWQAGWDLTREYPRLAREVREAVARETTGQRDVRKYLFPLLHDPRTAPKGGGVFQARPETLAAVQRGLLFNGGVEACDGTVRTHDTLPLTVYQVGVSLVSYRGDQGTWCQRLFHRDLRQAGTDPVAEMAELLRRRDRRSALNRTAADDPYSELVQRSLMAYAERAVLLRRAGPQAVWRMGHGNPVPYELLTGGGNLDLMLAATAVMRELVERHRKFVFVASEPRERMLLTIGDALRPLEYAVVDTLGNRLGDWIRQGRFKAGVARELDWDGERLTPVEWIPRFLDRVASQVVVGLYRASAAAPAQLFYAHADHSDLAAHIVLADSVLQEHRGFPLLIDLAHHVCAAVFGGDLEALTEAAYAEAGAPSRYFSERSTRD